MWHTIATSLNLNPRKWKKPLVLGYVHVFRQLPKSPIWQRSKESSVNGTSNYGIWYSRDSNDCLARYSNVDWAGCVNDRKSTSGGCFYHKNNLVSWMSKKQNSVSLSTAIYLGKISTCPCIVLHVSCLYALYCLMKCPNDIFSLFWTPMSTKFWGFPCFYILNMF